MGEEERVRGVQYTTNQGQEWTNIRTTAQEGDLQVSKKGLTWCASRKVRKRGLATKRDHKGYCEHVPHSMYIVLIKVVFRL
jgi:hypothetical protein